MSLDWFPWFPTAFRKKTLHLTLEQDGAYRRLIDEYMIQRGPLPNNENALSRMLGVSVEHWRSIAPAILAFFEAHGDKLVHGRCEEEIRAQELQGDRRSQISKEAATKRWAMHNEIKKLNASRMPKAMPRQSIPHAVSNAEAMPKHATLHKKDITTTFSVAARPSEETNPAGSLASALPAGALTRQPEIEQAAPAPIESPSPVASTEGHPKKPTEASRSELEALFALKRGTTEAATAKPTFLVKSEIDLTLPDFLRRTA